MIQESILERHKYYHFDDLQQSSMEFYEQVERSIQERQLPGVSCERVLFPEGRSILSANREYLKIARHEYRFYLCAAPFGKSFIISWWLKEEQTLFAALLTYIPFIGKWLARNSGRKTFYQVDTELMFKESIKNIVDAVINVVTSEKGRLLGSTP